MSSRFIVFQHTALQSFTTISYITIMKYILMFVVSALALGEQPRAHAEAAITLHLNAAPATVLPLFGPIREAEWAHGWNPAILYPTDRVQKPGAVFTTGKPGKETF
jgi:hypothetical protein